MPGDYEQLKRTIEDGVRAAEELQKLLAEQKREARPKFRLIKGGLIGAVIWAGVEWFRDYRRVAVAVAAVGIAAGAAVFAEQQDLGPPSAQPPSISVKPTPPRSSVSPPPPTDTVVTPTPTLSSPPRTSPLRTLAKPNITMPTPVRSTPTATARTIPTPTAVITLTDTPIVVTPSIQPSIDTCPGLITNLIEVKLCLRLG
jgi:hypothetical protein